MKKIFVVVVCVVCLLSLMIIPTFADAERFEVGDVFEFVSFDASSDSVPAVDSLGTVDVGVSADGLEYSYISNWKFRIYQGQLQYSGRTSDSGSDFVYLNVADYPFSITGV